MRIVLAEYSFDILAINESKIDSSISDNELHIIGNNIFRKDRNRHGGGMILYIRDNIPFSKRIDLTPKDLEKVCIEINRPHSKSVLLNPGYRSRSSDMNLLHEYADFLCKCEVENKDLIVSGDLNCDVEKTLHDKHTQKLQFICSLYQFDQLINEPTRITQTSASLIDLILTNKSENISQSGVVHFGITDHSLIFAIRKFTLPKTRKNSSMIREVRDFKNFVQNDFINDISRLPWDTVNQFGVEITFL